ACKINFELFSVTLCLCGEEILMKTSLSFAKPAEIETDCLALCVLDQGEKDKNVPKLMGADKAIEAAAANLVSSGEVTGKIFESVMLHSPAGLKAKRLLLVGGGKNKNFSDYELRKLAGTAVRFLKPKGIRSFAFVAPAWNGNTVEAVRAAVEGAFVGNFEPNTYQSDRKDQRIEQLTVVAPADGDQKALERALEEARILGESQNFTRELVNEPGNRMTPTTL